MLSVNWKALLNYAADIRDGMECELLSQIGLGYNHMIRIIRFRDKVQWVARLRLPSLGDEELPSDIRERLKCEASTNALVRQKTKIPVPEIYSFESSNNCSVKAPFMLVECFNGNLGMDLGMNVPLAHQQDFCKGLAKIQVSKTLDEDTATYSASKVELSTIQLPLIGTIQGIDEDGTIHQGPLPGLGGPFATAAEFFRAWGANSKFGISRDRLLQACGPFAAEIIPGIESFPTKLAAMADYLSKFDKGPFPLVHGDFGHNNFVVSDEYQILGVIDWEMAHTVPWKIAGDFPLTLSTIPPAMDAPWNYDEMGHPKDPETVKQFADQEGYIAQVKDAQLTSGITESPCLSDFLQDSKKQRLMTAMRLYSSGKVGFYSKLFEQISLLSK